MLNVYGHFFPMPSNKVRLCVSYLELPHEYHHVDLTKGEQQSSEFLKINPMARVPAIENDGFILDQSDAICKYLCAISDLSGFYPEDIHGQAKVNQWIDFSSQHVLHAMGRLFFNLVVTGRLGGDIDEMSVKTGRRMHARDLPHVETQLSENAYLTGDRLTLADITLIAALEPAEMVKTDLSVYPALTKWRKGIMDRNFYKRVHNHFGAEAGG